MCATAPVTPSSLGDESGESNPHNVTSEVAPTIPSSVGVVQADSILATLAPQVAPIVPGLQAAP